jgi:uncharacterized protein YndB with AHSA1/START domain
MSDVTTPSEPLRLRVRIDAQPDSVFAALTDPDALTEWLTDSAEVDLDADRYEFWGRYVPQGDRPRQRLQQASPDTIRFDWDFDGADPSTVTLSIAAHDEGGTLVTVEHTGIPADGTADATALACFWLVSLANLAAQCEGLPTMPPFDFSVPAQGDALVRTVIDVPAEEVYASLLDPAQVDRWAGGHAVIEPEIGGRYDFGWDHGPTKIVDLQPDKVVAYSWRYPDSPETLVRWNLRDSRGSTYLTLVHSGFDNDQLAEQFRQGWPGFLVELKRMLELGQRWEPMKVA